MRVVSVSDTHARGVFPIPSGDLLIHAGDLTGRGRLPEVQSQVEWLASLGFERVLLVAGNHDWLFQLQPDLARSLIPSNVTYLQDSGIEINGFTFWGSPWQPEFCDWAFNLPRGEQLKAKWDLIPDGTDVVITHGPARKILDYAQGGSHVGCSDLARRLLVVKPLLHVCGHVHEGNGSLINEGTLHVNAAICDRDHYDPVQKPKVVDLFQDEDGVKKALLIDG